MPRIEVKRGIKPPTALKTTINNNNFIITINKNYANPTVNENLEVKQKFKRDTSKNLSMSQSRNSKSNLTNLRTLTHSVQDHLSTGISNQMLLNNNQCRYRKNKNKFVNSYSSSLSQ